MANPVTTPERVNPTNGNAKPANGNGNLSPNTLKNDTTDAGGSNGTTGVDEEQEEGDDDDEDDTDNDVTSMGEEQAKGHVENGRPQDPDSVGELGVNDEEDEDEEDDDEDEDDEPALKYERLGGGSHEVLEKDTASSLSVSTKFMAMGTHNGVVHVMDHNGSRVKSFRPHSASINDIRIDTFNEFVATAAMDGQVVIHSISGSESYAFDLRRPLRAIALDPQFSKRGTRAFVCGGLAGNLVMYEKGWLGHKDSLLHSNEGPIWAIEWKETFIAWANDAGIKIYDTASRQRIAFIDRPPDSPRADLFKCSLWWQDETSLLIAWADHIKLVRIKSRPPRAASVAPGAPPFVVEITAHFQVDCMISGIVPYYNPLGSFLFLAYIPPDNTLVNEDTNDLAAQRRKAANRPELRIISRAGEELSSDALNLQDFHQFGCNDYHLHPVQAAGGNGDPYLVVMSPRNVILVKPRDAVDHVEWLVEKQRYEEALAAVERLGEVKGFDVSSIGKKYIEHLISDGDFAKAAHLAPKVFRQNVKDWEDCIYTFAGNQKLQDIIPYVPTKSPRLTRTIYELILVHFLGNDREALLKVIKEWPTDIYDIGAVIVAVKAELDRSPKTRILMDCLAELYILNRQPGKALEYFLRLRRPNVFDLIRDNNLFTVVRDQALLLVEFDQELEKKRREEAGLDATKVVLDNKGKGRPRERSAAITLLVDHRYSIPVTRVVQQLQVQPYYLYLYLDALFDKDPHLTSDFSDNQVQLYADFAPERLIDFLRASSSFSLEKAYKTCAQKNLVPEMVFLLGRMGNNKKALNLIIERLGDVNRAIDFAKEQNDDDLWEDLLKYSETRPPFIRGLLENVGAEIDPIRLIRRIKNGLEIPGLKEALIKILWDFNLQISLLEGCQTILHSDCTALAVRLRGKQTQGTLATGSRLCPICNDPLFLPYLPTNTVTSTSPQPTALLFLCRHLVHIGCVRGGDKMPMRPVDDGLVGLLGGSGKHSGAAAEAVLSGKIAFAAVVRSRLEESCPVCKRGEGGRGPDVR